MEEKELTNRIHYLDIIKAIGIILVIVGHIEKNHLSENISRFIFSFHMPLFFIVSGMIIKLKDEETKPLKEIVAKKSKSLLIPYFWFSLIFIIIDLVRLILGFDEPQVIIEVLINTVTFYADSTLWFLPALLVAELCYLLIYEKVARFFENKDKKFVSNMNNFKHIAILTTVILLCFAALGYVVEKLLLVNAFDGALITVVIKALRVLLRGVIASFFVSLGVLIFDRMPVVKPNKFRRVIMLVAGIMILVSVYFLSNNNITVDIRRVDVGNIPIFMLTSLLGSAGIVLIGISIWKLKIMEFFGRNTLIIMCTHLNFYILFWSMNYALFLNDYITHAKSYFLILNVIIACLVLESLLILLIRKVFPFVIGLSTRRKS